MATPMTLRAAAPGTSCVSFGKSLASAGTRAPPRFRLHKRLPLPGAATRHRPASGQVSRQASVSVKAGPGYKETGRQYQPNSVKIKRVLGEGAYGMVFEGEIEDADEVHPVVLKRVKQRVEGAQEAVQMEHMLNALVSNSAKGVSAHFMGYLNVKPTEASGRLTQGLWLVWEYAGDKTLQYFLRRRDCNKALAKALGVTEQSAVPTAMSQVLQCLEALHAAGIVHRDIKPHNIILDEKAKAFRLIDLGAAADLRTGINYTPDESILDMNYCAPEMFVLPTNSMDLADQVLPLAMMMSPMLWAKHQPDRFDIYSTGLVLMQLAIPGLRSDQSLKNFRRYLEANDFDLKSWRESNRMAKDVPILESESDAGWKLAGAMLRNRALVGDEDENGVKQRPLKGPGRPSASVCRRHPFCRLQANQQAEPKEETAGAWDNAFAVWKSISSKMFDLEARIAAETAATQTQKGTVKKLAEEVARGNEDPATLAREEAKLERMEAKLEKDERRFDSLVAGARRWLAAFMGGGKTAGAEETADSNRASEDEAELSSVPALPNTVPLGERAARFAGQMAASLKADAERRQAKIALQREERRAEKEAARALVTLLNQVEPPVAAGDTWADVKGKIAAANSEIEILTEDKRQDVFSLYVARIKEAEDKKIREAALAEERARRQQEKHKLAAARILQQEEDKARAEELARQEIEEQQLTAARSQEQEETREKELLRRQKEEEGLLAARIQRRVEAEAAEEQLKREVAFRQMLEEVQDPQVTSSSSWVGVRRRIWADMRFNAIAEDRRKDLFLEYIEVLKDYESSLKEPAPVDLTVADPIVLNSQSEDISMSLWEQEGHLDVDFVPTMLKNARDEVVQAFEAVKELRELQITMQSEYSQLDAKLADMEKALFNKKKKDELKADGKDTEPVTFSFSDEVKAKLEEQIELTPSHGGTNGKSPRKGLPE